MRKILDGFAHERGIHSDTSSLRDILSFSGHSLSEAAIFGLGEGLGFYYWKGKNLKYPLIGGRSGVLELDRRVSRNLGISLKICTSTSPRRAYDSMKEILLRDMPVMVHADIFYLRYLGSSRHYGAHSIVVAGIDEGSGTAFIADRSMDGLVELPISQLMDARASISKPFPPRNRWMEFRFPGNIRIDDKVIMGAISRNSLEMLNSDIRNLGIGGIYYFANCLSSWRKEYGEKGLEKVCNEAYASIESHDTGGGCFRYMYADFLRYAYDITGIDTLKDVSDGYRKAGTMWTHAARMIRDIPCGCISIAEVQSLVSAIGRKEQELQTDLLCAANLCCKRKT